MDTATSTERHAVSWESWNFMHHEIARLQAENAQLRAEVENWQHQTNHWYMKANYSETEIAAFARRRSRLPRAAAGDRMPDAQHNAA